MAIDAAAVFTNFTGAFPDVVSVNSTGPSTTDGTEFVKIMIDNYMFGPQQAILDYANLTPDSVPEAAGASQTIEAIQKGFAVGPGKYVLWGLNDTPATTKDRVILLTNGATQGVLRATYGDLDSSCYVGDGNNATAPYFYHASDAAGTARLTTGAYLILPPGKQLYERMYLGDGTDFTLTNSASGTLIRCVATPYQTEDGAWWLKGAAVIDVTTISNCTWTFSGVVFKAGISKYNMAVTYADASNSTKYKAYANPGTANILSATSGATTDWASITFDLELDSEPTWTDGFNYKLGICY